MNKNIDYTALGKRIKIRGLKRVLRRNSSANCANFLRHISVTLSVGQEYFPLMFFFRISQALDTSIDWLVFDSVENKHMLNEINSVLKNTDKTKVTTFLNTVRVLADNIDKL